MIPKRDNNQLSDQQAADQEWQDNIINNDSLVFNLFQVHELWILSKLVNFR